MRNECNIIRDILPLYADKMVSADTESFVEEHLIGCAECRAELEKLKVADVIVLGGSPLFKHSGPAQPDQPDV